MKRFFESPSKVVRVSEQLEAMLADPGQWGRRLLGYRDLARKLGVSCPTVQAALARVEAAGLVERRHGSGTYALHPNRRPRPRQLGVVIGDKPPEGLWSAEGEMLEGIMKQARRLRTGCRLFVWSDPADRAAALERRVIRQFDSFILIRLLDPLLVHRLLKSCRGRVIVLDENTQGLAVTAIYDDSFRGARQAGRHLLALGHRRIAFVDTEESDKRNASKSAGYQTALAERGLTPDPALIVTPAALGVAANCGADAYLEAGVARLLGLAAPPSAIFVYDDWRALKVMKLLRARGLVVGRDMSVAGFGDTAVRGGERDGLTSVRIAFGKLGQEAARAASRPEAGMESILVNDTLIKRTSTGAYREQP